MVKCPVLGKVPGIGQEDLQLKASASGVTFLPKTRFRQRYTGSKKSAVSINGKLYVNKKKLQEAIDSWVERGKKKSGRRVSKPENFSMVRNKDTNDISTAISELSTNSALISTSAEDKPSRSYSINKKEVRQRILGYLNSMSGKKELYFWTVTFPQGTTDDACYQLFNTWLTQLRKYRMLKEYLWIAERQPLKTKTIHFHIAVPHRMDVVRANSMMKVSLRTLAMRGDIPFTPMQCYKYNGVDIAKDRKTRRVINFALRKKSRTLAYYLTKYVTKNDERFSHLAWHNSRGYSAIFTGVTFTVGEFRKMGYGYYLDRGNKKVMEFAVFIPWREEMPPPIRDHLYQLNTFIQSQLN